MGGSTAAADDDDNNNNLISILHSASGAVAKVHTYGATVTSFVTQRQREVLFVSRLAKMDGSKAIRGGIPLVFPIFGPSAQDDDMPQHGFARCNHWSFLESEYQDTTDEAIGILELNYNNPNVNNGIGTKGFWSKHKNKDDCSSSSSSSTGTPNVTLRLTIRVRPESLVTTLTIINTSSSSSVVTTPLKELQALFHTYYKVYGSAAMDPNSCGVISGLDGYTMVDKLLPPTTTTTPPTTHPPNTPVIIDGEVDRIYTPSSSNDDPNPSAANLIIATGNDGSQIQLQVEAVHTTDTDTDTTQLPISIVVWNPHIKKAQGMSDFADEQYHDMICVEPGILTNVPPLEPTQQIVFTQTITSL